MQKVRNLLAVLLLAFATGCTSPPQSSPVIRNPGATREGWSGFVTSFLDEYFRFRPDLAVAAGRHEFDGRLPDWSPEGMALMVHFLKERRASAAKFEPTTRAQVLEHAYLLAQIDSDLFWIEVAESPYTNPSYYTSFQGLDPNVYVTREYAPLDQRMRAFMEYARNVPKAAEQIQHNLRTPMPRSFIDIGRTGFGGLASFIEMDVPKIFAPVQDSALQAEFAEVNAEAAAALNRLDKWLESQIPTANNNFALGPEKFKRMLWD